MSSHDPTYDHEYALRISALAILKGQYSLKKHEASASKLSKMKVGSSRKPVYLFSEEELNHLLHLAVSAGIDASIERAIDKSNSTGKFDV